MCHKKKVWLTLVMNEARCILNEAKQPTFSHHLLVLSSIIICQKLSKKYVDEE
jgi:hypothetical protein